MEELWNNLNERINWPILNRILHKRSLPTAQGLTKTFQKLQNEARIKADVQRNYNALKLDLTEVILYRDKYLKFFDLNNANKSALLTEIQRLTQNFTSGSNLGHNFPLDDDGTTISQTSIDQPELIRILNVNNGYALVFSTIREVKTRENLLGRFDGISGVSFIDDYTSVYGELISRVQFYDIINLDTRRGILEFRIDNRGESMTNNFLERSYAQMVNKAIAMFGHLTSIDFNGRNHNYYSMLHPLYSDGSQGKVKEMAFVTDSDSLKHEHVNRINNEDLRLDDYHEGGKNRVGSMDFYRLGVSWDVDISCKNVIGLSVLGKQYMLNARGGAYIGTCFINSCHVADEYNFVLDIIQDYA